MPDIDIKSLGDPYTPTTFVRVLPALAGPDAIVRDDNGQPIGLTVEIVGEGLFVIPITRQ